MRSSIIITSVALLVAPVFARGPWAGGIDMNEACRMQLGENGEAYSVGDSGSDWRCRVKVPTAANVDTNSYCNKKYGNNAYSDPQGGKKYDWGCYFPN